MQYRNFGRLNINVSPLGFGAMRLPTIGGVDSQIDEEHAAAMMAYAFDHGINYVDTAYPYHEGKGEPFVGRVLQQGYRDRVFLATKMPVWAVQTATDFDRLLNEQLQRLRTERIDFYLLHCLHAGIWPRLRELGILAWAEKAKTDGRMSAFGFSFHDSLTAFKEIVDDYDWALCQIQYNYMNEEVQAGTEGLLYAAAKGLAVVVMEPLLGGGLAQLPEPVLHRLVESGSHLTPADLALRWLWDKPEVALVLSGMTTMEQVQQNVASAARSGVGLLTARERELIGKLRQIYEKQHPISCTNCRYCLPCPNGVDIPLNLRLYNDAKIYGQNGFVLNRNLYRMLPASSQAGSCKACQECEPKCPQQLPIPSWLERINKEFAAP
jgi:hypothetical protein